MKRKLLLDLYLVFALVYFAGCKANHEVQKLDKPSIKTVGLRLEDVEYDDVTLLFDVEVDNPYPSILPLRTLNYSLMVEDGTFLNVTSINPVVILPDKRETVTLSDTISYARLLDDLNSEPGTEIRYKASLRLSMDTPGSGLIELTSEKEGRLALPDVPGIIAEEQQRLPDVIYVPTPQDVVERMLELAEVTKDTLVYDLGCGDGRIPVTAAKKYGCKAVGYDIDPQRIKESLANVERNKVGHLVTIEQEDIFTLDLSKAQVITLYLLPSLNVKLIPQLEKLRPGSRIVSHDFDMRGVKPDKVIKLSSEHDHSEHEIYLWTTPLKKETENLVPVQSDFLGDWNF
jgi:precorrin-6B methylase 2/LEA14-like dessication related protein